MSHFYVFGKHSCNIINSSSIVHSGNCYSPYLKKFIDGETVSYDTVQYAREAFEKYHLLERKVRDVK